MAAPSPSLASHSFSSPSRESPSGPLPPPSPSSGAAFKSPQDSKASSLSPPPPEASLPLAVFYGPLDAKNPLLASFEKEIRELLCFLRRKKAFTTAGEQKHELLRRCATTLFNIWTKYALRLPTDYYNEKLLKVGDSLCEIKEYKLALLQCYGRYLQQFSTDFDENNADVNQFKAVFFPKGYGDKTAAHTFHALNGKNICSYQLICDSDVNLQNKDSLAHCLRILSSFRLLMQVALPQEHLCWIIFNGTIYIYTICRKLMVLGQSAKALEYLLWASICMESSVPLLSVRYLTWRATLYTAVCQCYYDCQASIHGETFARRGLVKIDELRQLELMSSSQSQEESRNSYREATIKMPWPCTTTERLLDEMFDSNASRFLAVLEALSDSNRRILQAGPAVTDETETRDVVTELFIAGRALLIMSNIRKEGIFDFPLTPFLKLIVGGKNVISLDAAMAFVKLAFTYEEWSLFESLAGKILEFLQGRDEPESKKAEKNLILLVAIEPLINVKKSKGIVMPFENYKEGHLAQDFVKKFVLHDTCVKTYAYSEDIFYLAAVLFSCLYNCPQDTQPDKEIVVDMIMFLWQKCKFGIQRINIPKNDYAKFAQKISTNKWVYLLWQISEVIQCYRTEDIDIVMMAEVTLRISEILETLGNPKRKFKKSLGIPAEKRIEEFLGTPKGSSEILPIFKKEPIEQLFLAYKLLDQTINGINLHYMITNLPNGLSVIDHCYTKYPCAGDGGLYKPVTTNTFIMDLHLELIQSQHRIATVLLYELNVLQTPDVSKNIPNKAPVKLKQSKSPDCFTELTVMNKIGKNKISRATFLIQKALLIFEKDATCLYSKDFLMEAYSLIEKAEAEQNALYLGQKHLESSERKKSKVPPPPVLLSRTHCSVTLKPAPFTADVKVSWYTILGCKAEGSFGKVRLNNNHLPNSGEAIPADGKTVFEVKDLETNEKYVFAIAAYSSTGKLIGNAIGESTKPILIHPPLSTVTARMYLTQAAYQIGEYELAKKIFSPVWDYFVASPPQDDQMIISLSNIMTVKQRRLHSDILAETSSTLLYLFLRNIFVTSDIKIKEEHLFCDNIKGNEISPSQNIARLVECERILVALELSNYLNDSSFALQAVTQCYGLLAPMIFHNIVLVPVVQILIKCLAVLQVLPNVLHSRKNAATFESSQHMIACCVYYLTKILRSWREYDLAVMIINYGRRMLDVTPGCKSLFGFSDREEVTEEESKKILIGKPKKLQQPLIPEKINEQLVMLETHLLRLMKQVSIPELSGAEDPIFLYPIVFNWPAKGAIKEVLKFKHRPRFLEFFTQVMLKCLNDEKFHLVLEITNPVIDFLRRRHESLTGMRRTRNKDNMGKKGQKLGKKYKAVIMEIGRTDLITRKRNKKRETLREFLSRNPNIYEMMEQERNKRSDVRKAAQKFLLYSLSPLVINYIKKKKLHHIYIEELPWRSLMNLYLAIAYFNLFLTKLVDRIKGKCSTLHTMVSFRSCDPSMFSLYNSGTLLPTKKLSLEYYKMMFDFLLTSRKRKANAPSDADELSAFISAKLIEESTGKKQSLQYTDSQMGLALKEKDRSNLSILDNFTKVFLFCRRAMVLAHRGGYWTLLQNCCRALWNFTQELQILHKQNMDMSKTFPVSNDGFLCTIVLPFYLGAELLLDMLLELQNINAIKVMEDKGEFSVPSCYGNIKTDNGGFSLTFEQPLDNVNMVDLKWIHDFVLKSLELLYQVEKWEALVSLAIQFNAISHERYLEQVTPLLVYAQRQLLVRISLSKEIDITQQACARYEAEHGEKITYKNFIGKQLKIRPTIKKVSLTRSSAEVPHSFISSENNLAKDLVCVPVDVTDTLRCFRETLEKSKYHNRCIRHSRKLLSLFLAQLQDKGRTSSPKVGTGKVEFCLQTEEMYMPTPPDLSQEHFRIFSSVEKSRLPLSQLGLVISSYYKTVDVLGTSNQRSLKVQALHELGNLLIFAEKKRAALKCWSQALDDLFQKQDVLHSWKEFGTSHTSVTSSCSPPQLKDYSEEFLSKMDIWGCLQGAVISAKIAQFIQTLDVSKRINCCILSALLFQGLLRTTLPHPKAERCYALYEVTQLLPGIELFSDRYRADICTVIASLYYVIRELHFAKHDLIILPLLALYQYFVSGICQDLVRNLEARILKIEVLIDLRFFSEAFAEMIHIFNGKNMPSSIPAGYKSFGKVKIFQSFDAGKPLYYKENIQALEELISKGTPPILTTVGQQHLLNKYSFVKAYFLINVAAMINCIPENITKSSLSYEKHKINILNFKEQILKEEGSSALQLTKPKDDLLLCTIKSVLLAEAEDRLNSLLVELDHSAHRSLSQYSAGDLETVVEVQLQLADIALQRHRAAYSSAIVFSILRLLQDSKLFKKKVSMERRESSISTSTVATEQKDDEFLDPISLHAREYFNIHLWLRCCLALVTAFVAQVRGIGIVTENDLTDVDSLINDALMEAKNSNDKELQAEFLMQAVIIGLQEKHLKSEIITKLQDIMQLLQGNVFISPRSHLTLARSMLLMDDLTKAEKFRDNASLKTDKLHSLVQCHDILIKQLLTLGEMIEFPASNTDYASPIQPLKNIYLPHIMLLAKTKMRIGHSMAKQCQNSRMKDSSRWLPSLHILQTALKLCRISGTEEHEVEAEILFQKGKIERQMFMEERSSTSKFESLFEAIQLSLKNDQNSGLIRDSYLEMAILFLHLMKSKSKLSVSPLPSVVPVRRHSSLKDQLGNRVEMYSSLAWIAIRAATQVSEAVLAVNLHFGKKNARIDKANQDTLPTIPEFATMDLFSSYTDYLLGSHHVVFQTGGNQSVFYQSDDSSENTDATKKTEPKVDVTWILLLRYYIHLQRTNNMSKLLASLKSETGNSVQVDSLFTSLFNSALILRQKEMHFFLKKFLQLYSTCCIDEFPKELVQEWENLPSDKSLSDSSGKVVYEPSVSTVVSLRIISSPVDKTVLSTDMATQALNKELCFQWYIPPLEKPPRDTEPMVLLLYAYNLKPMKISDVKYSTYSNAFVGSLWIPLNRVISVHEKLSNLAQIAEISLPASSEIMSDENKSEKVMDVKPIDKDIEFMVLECCNNILSLLLSEKDISPLFKVPFDISLQSILDLERLFDLANGCVLSGGSLFQWIVSLIT